MVEQHFNPEAPQADSSEAHPASSPPHILSPRRPPTIHDPTIKPPWKKHKWHQKQPSPDWAMLWPRPPGWYCPPDASILTNYAGCHYIEPPEVFDPEIEKLPDWMGPEEREERFWYGVERVVSPEQPAKEVKTEAQPKAVKRHMVVAGEDLEVEFLEGENVDESKAVVELPQPPKEFHKTHSTLSIVTSTSISSSIPTSTSTSTWTPTPTPEPLTTGDSFKQHTVESILIGVIFPVICIGACFLVCWYIASKNKKVRAKSEQTKSAARARAAAAATRRAPEAESRDTRSHISDRSLEEVRSKGTSVQEDWEEVTLRDFTVG